MEPVLFCLPLLLFVPIISTTRTTLDAAVSPASLAGLPSFVYNQFGRTFSDQRNKCIDDGSEYLRYHYLVGREFPCQNGELYVYNRTEVLSTKGSLEPVCQTPPCPRGYSFLLPDKKCYRDDDIRKFICYGQQYPSMNLFGETFCSCGYGKATLLNSGKTECHRLFTQGPCGSDSLFVPVNDLVNFGQGQCLPSPCAKLLNGNKSMAEIRLRNGRRYCFELNTRGPCRNNYTLGIIDNPEFRGVPHLSCLEEEDVLIIGGVTQITARRDECVVNNEDECVVPLKNNPVEPRFLHLDES